MGLIARNRSDSVFVCNVCLRLSPFNPKLHVVSSLLKENEYITFVPKLEYQPQFGHEQVTRSEMCRAWLGLKLKPQAKIWRSKVTAIVNAVEFCGFAFCFVEVSGTIKDGAKNF